MKKSELYLQAQIAVLHSDIDDEGKLEILRELIDARESALWSEKREEERKAKQNENV